MYISLVEIKPNKVRLNDVNFSLIEIKSSTHLLCEQKKMTHTN